MNPEEIFPGCSTFFTKEQWGQLFQEESPGVFPEKFAQISDELQKSWNLPAYLDDLARLEWILFQARQRGCRQMPETVQQLTVNPTLELIKLDWQHLPALLRESDQGEVNPPQPGEEFILVYCQPQTGKVHLQTASEADLLALKIVIDDLSPELLAKEQEVPVGRIDQSLSQAVHRGILLKPESRIRRNPDSFPRGNNIPLKYFSSPVFTLQWHITQVCDLHCKHCYDRSDRVSLQKEQGFHILDDLRRFCLEHHVRGQISFSGGNPLLHPHFFEFYQGAVDRNLMVAILGNPASKETMEKILAIKKPVFYQVSLEGLEEHNNYIRGKGHYRRVMEFLDLLRELDVYSMVMLTLTRDNMDQVLPLGEELRQKVDLFTFNRLAMVGEGAQLKSAEPDEYAVFLKKYMDAATENPILSLKDNLMNIIRKEQGQPFFGGCAGHGCGAAFNFFSILPDGEAHACRKLPSYIGNVFEKSIHDVYHGEKAKQYRAGTEACSACSIRPVCGGCLAVVHGFGLDVFHDKDPYCFIE
ncbi:MAG: selenobiotic family peptide radical SAM maturase [Desulfobulbaceae bacterium]|nr:selenobiotic family peptide radical SAM maturase [Desulfobulbaceae bacterium]